MLKEKPLNFQNVITHQHEHDSLDGGHSEQYRNLRKDVTAAAEVKKLFAFEDLSVLDDLFGTHGQTHEKRDDNTHEQVRRNVEVLAEHVLTSGLRIHMVISHDEREDERQQGSLQEVNDQILRIMKFCQHIAHSKQESLFSPAGNIQR